MGLSLEISIHAVLWDRDPSAVAERDNPPISIHAVLWDRDVPGLYLSRNDSNSIHAVLWDRDYVIESELRKIQNFNPRGPLGPRRRADILRALVDAFNPRGPSGTATPLRGCLLLIDSISIHAVLWDRDWDLRGWHSGSGKFQSTRSSGTATCKECQERRNTYFNPRGPLGPRLITFSR